MKHECEAYDHIAVCSALSRCFGHQWLRHSQQEMNFGRFFSSGGGKERKKLGAAGAVRRPETNGGEIRFFRRISCTLAHHPEARIRRPTTFLHVTQDHVTFILRKLARTACLGRELTLYAIFAGKRGETCVRDALQVRARARPAPRRVARAPAAPARRQYSHIKPGRG